MLFTIVLAIAFLSVAFSDEEVSLFEDFITGIHYNKPVEPLVAADSFPLAIKGTCEVMISEYIIAVYIISYL